VVVDSLWSPRSAPRKRFLVYLPPSYAARPRAATRSRTTSTACGATRQLDAPGRLDAAADSLRRLGRPELVVVMPDGDDSWYTTWHTLGTATRAAPTPRAASPPRLLRAVARYDEYVARDLVARVDSAYRTRADRGHRGVAG
jgi:hypothetical protein